VNQAAISRGKEIIKQQIRLAQPGEAIRIPVEDEVNLNLFMQALRGFDVQRMLVQKNNTVEFYIPQSPVEQAKNHILNIITTASDDVRQIVFPTLPRDYADYEAALALPEIQTALQQRGITASLQRVSQPQEIVIATYEQVINGDLDRFMEQFK
jgi:hypothetical protein